MGNWNIHILRVIPMNAPFVFCNYLVDYSGNVCLWICSRFGSVIRSFLPFNTVEYKSWRAVTMDCWKSAEVSFWALYGKRRIGVWPAELSYMTTCCHYRLWRPFSGDKKSSHFSGSFLTARQQQKITTDGNRPAPWLLSLEVFNCLTSSAKEG